MSKFVPKSTNRYINSDSSEEDYDDDELITIQFNSQNINIYYLQFSKYSKVIRNEYLISDIRNRLLGEIVKLQSQLCLDSENIILFFTLLHDDFNFDEQLILSYKQYIDLIKISDYFQVKKLKIKLEKYIKKHKDDTQFIIEIIQYEIDNRENEDQITEYKIDLQMEEVLSREINKILTDENFPKLPISIIYRIIEKSSTPEIKSDTLYDFIMKSIDKFHILFMFLDIESLSDNRCEMLYEKLTRLKEDEGKNFFGYLPCNLKFIIDIKQKNKQLEKELENTSKTNSIIENEKSELQIKVDELKSKTSQLQNQVEKTEEEKTELQTRLKMIEKANSQLHIQIEKLNEVNNQLEKDKIQIQTRLDEVEQEKKQIQEELKLEIENNKCKITGKILARKKGEMFVNAEIELAGNSSFLDTSKSKYIINTSDSEILGKTAYKKGELIKSMKMTTNDILVQQGIHYVHALITDINGKTSELISNSVETKNKILTFDYEGKPREITLSEGRYKLEVWGGQGGDSAGGKYNSSVAEANGGLGGYSTGILSLNKETKVFVYVGGAGMSGKSGDGACTSGGFPDGGGTKTGHCSGRTSVPGTGGGSSSIRISTDSLYSRVIVAGGGGGAGGDSEQTDHGGFGGGMKGGNSSTRSQLRDKGSGTQTGSTPGPRGSGPEGVAGTFGHGATGLYCSNSDSGGGGGGGWYGGGSGGYGGNTNCASGGGGSGWVFTSSSFSEWKSGDSSEANRFLLDSSFYLTDAKTIPGDTSFPSPTGNSDETGHRGNGYAKITSL